MSEQTGTNKPGREMRNLVWGVIGGMVAVYLGVVIGGEMMMIAGFGSLVVFIALAAIALRLARDYDRKNP